MVVEFERAGHIAVITLNRPDARNAINGDLAAGIEQALDDYEADEQLWVAILTGRGSVFCAGADLKEIAAGNVASLRTERGGFAGLVQRQRTKPLIAALNGAAVAGGLELVLACDMAIAADNVVVGLPEVKRSLVAAAGGVFRLPRAIGKSIAMEMILSGDTIAATRAYELGLINKWSRRKTCWKRRERWLRVLVRVRRWPCRHHEYWQKGRFWTTTKPCGKPLWRHHAGSCGPRILQRAHARLSRNARRCGKRSK